MNKKLTKFIGSALCLLLATSSVITAAPSIPIETPFAPKEDLRFAVMSDTHIGASTLANYPNDERMANAYKIFNEIDPDMDAVVTVGDMTESGTQAQFDSFKKIVEENSTADATIFTMGNHDNYALSGDAGLENFEKTYGFPATNDRVVAGFHFITLSPTDRTYNTESYAQYIGWLEERLAAANAEDPTKPIFIFTHQTTRDTCTGSRNSFQATDFDLYEVYSKYPQVITFSGHSHTSPIDPKNIWQGDFTALNCGSVYYAALEYSHWLTEGMMDNTNVGYSPYNRGESSTAMVVDVDGTKVTIRRLELYYGREIAAPFVFDMATPVAERPYRIDAMTEKSSAPAFAANAKVTISNVTDTSCTYTFPQAVNQSKDIQDDGAFVYLAAITDAKTGEEVHTARLHSNSFMVPQPEAVSFDTATPEEHVDLVKNNTYNISVTPMNFFGKLGEPLTDTFTLTAQLDLATDANLESGGENNYFYVDAALQSEAAANTARITYTYDTEKFAFRGYTAAEGVQSVLEEKTETGTVVTVMIDDYKALDLGRALFSGIEGVTLAADTAVMNIAVDYVVKAGDGTKSIEKAIGNISFTTVGSGPVGDYDGDGEITLIDLSNIIDFFGTKAGDPDWDKAKFFDSNNNGEIDIFDISSIAKEIK